jgi:hypothetical protein
VASLIVHGSLCSQVVQISNFKGDWGCWKKIEPPRRQVRQERFNDHFLITGITEEIEVIAWVFGDGLGLLFDFCIVG